MTKPIPLCEKLILKAVDNEKSILKHFSTNTGTLYILKIITKVKVIKIIAYLKLKISVKNSLVIKQNN